MKEILFPVLLLISCGSASGDSRHAKQFISPDEDQESRSEDQHSWTYFLSHLPVVDAPIKDFRGRDISYQEKHTGIIPYDVGNADLQQCADAIMRLRAEYLFAEKKFDSISFHFVSGQSYSWNQYCEGLRPVAKGQGVIFVRQKVQDRSHASLRAYLDLVYAYASTISLAKELIPSKNFGIGKVVIHPGSPGHCFIIIDERKVNGKTEYKLAEGYTPAQSIYILRDPDGNEDDCWYELDHSLIETASYTFSDFRIGSFE